MFSRRSYDGATRHLKCIGGISEVFEHDGAECVCSTSRYERADCRRAVSARRHLEFEAKFARADADIYRTKAEGSITGMGDARADGRGESGADHLETPQSGAMFFKDRAVSSGKRPAGVRGLRVRDAAADGRSRIGIFE